MAAASPVTVSVALTGTGAAAGVASPVTVVFAGSTNTGTRTMILEVPIAQDQTVEAAGAVTASLQEGTGYLLLPDIAMLEAGAMPMLTPAGAGATLPVAGARSARIEVRDDDRALLTIAAQQPAVREGAAAAFRIRTSNPLAADLAVRLATTGAGGFLDGTPPATVTLPMGEREVVFRVATREVPGVSSGTVTVALAAGDGAYRIADPVAGGRATVVVNDASGAAVSIDTDFDAVHEGATVPFALTFLGGPAPAGGLTVNVALSETGGLMLLAGAGVQTVSIPAGATRAAFEVATVGDETDEGGGFGTLTAAVQPGAGYTPAAGAAGMASVRVQDTGPLLRVSVAADAESIVEGGTAAFTVSSAAPAPSGGLEVYLGLADTAGAYIAAETVLSDTVTIPAGERTARYTYMVADDSQQQGDGRLVLVLSGPELPPEGRVETPAEEMARLMRNSERFVYQFGPNTWAAVTVEDDDSPPAVSIAAVADAVAEGSPARFRLRASRTLAAALTVTVQLAQEGMVYAGAASRTVEIASGTQEAVFGADTVDDDAVEESGAVVATVAAGAGYTVDARNAAARVAVTSEDLPVLTVADAAAPEDGALRFAVRLSAAPVAPVSVAYRTMDGTAMQPADYAQTSGTLTLAAGERDGVIEVATRMDADADEDTLTVVLSSLSGATFAGGASMLTAMGTITEGPIPAVTIADAGSVTEGGVLAFAVTLSEAAERDLAIAYRVSGTGAYTDPRSGMLRVPAGQTGATVEIETTADADLDEETLTVSLLAGTGYTLGAQSAASGRIVEGPNPQVVAEAQAATLPHVATAVSGAVAGALSGRVASVFEGRGLGGGQGLLADEPLPGAVLKRYLAARAERERGAAGLDFALPLSAAAGRRSVRTDLTAWGRGFHRQLDTTDGGVRFSGDVTGGAVGLDIHRGGLVLGLGASESTTDLDYAGTGTGRHETRLTGVHPYFGYQSGPSLQLWGALGISSGEVKVSQDGAVGFVERDVDMESASLGLSRTLSVRGDARSGSGAASSALVADGTYARIDEDGGVDAEAGWVRAGLELARRRTLAGGGQLGGTLGLVARQDFGDTLSGSGAEIEGALDLSLPHLGLRLDVKLNALLAHTEDTDDWGVSGGLVWREARDHRGLSVSFRPRIGRSAQRERVWEPGATAGAAGADRYGVELRYGVPVLDGTETLNMYARGDIADADGALGFGATLNLRSNLALGYEAALARPAASEADDHRVYLRLQSRF